MAQHTNSLKPQEAEKEYQSNHEQRLSTAVHSGSSISPGKSELEEAAGAIDEQEGIAFNERLTGLKDQIFELRTSIKNFETDLDARLDACFKCFDDGGERSKVL